MISDNKCRLAEITQISYKSQRADLIAMRLLRNSTKDEKTNFDCCKLSQRKCIFRRFSFLCLRNSIALRRVWENMKPESVKVYKNGNLRLLTAEHIFNGFLMIRNLFAASAKLKVN